MGVIDYLRNHGFDAKVKDNHLVVSPSSKLTPEVRQYIKANKLVLIAALSAAKASPEWVVARDQYINHLMVCRACYAPTSRYCAAGTALRQQYNAITW